MRLKIFVLIFTLSLFLVATDARKSKAESPSFETLYSDYVFNYDQYRKARDAYDLARSNYLASKTLTAKSEAESATLKMLQFRDEVVITHLTALKEKISGTPGISQADKDSAFPKIDAEINWHRAHKDGLSSAGSLENLVTESAKAKARFNTYTQVVMYKDLALVETGKVDDLRGRSGKVISDINSKLSEIRQNGDKSTQKSERWLLDTDARIERSGSKEDEAKRSLGQIDTEFVTKSDVYNQFQTLIIESNQFLKEAVSYMREIVKDIKTQD